MVVGGERIKQFARYLPEHGFDPIVVTHGDTSSDRIDAGIVTAPDLFRIATGTIAEPSKTVLPNGRLLDLGVGIWRTVLWPYLFPDRTCYTWAPWAIRASLRAADRRRPSAVLSSSPPAGAHLAGHIIARILRVPWIADFRDGFSFEPPEGDSLVRPLRRVFDRYLVERAAVTLCVTDPLRDDFRALVPSQADRIVTLTNGFDPDLVGRGPDVDAVSAGPFTVLYAGTTNESRKSYSLENVLAAVVKLSRDTSCRLSLVGVDPVGEGKRYGVHPNIEVLGWRPRTEAVRHMEAADVLVVLTGNESSLASSKLFDYIGAGRPILVVGARSAAADIVSHHGFGLVAEDTPDSIESVLRELLRDRDAWRDKLASDEVRSARARYSRAELTAELANMLRQVVAGRVVPPER